MLSDQYLLVGHFYKAGKRAGHSQSHLHTLVGGKTVHQIIVIAEGITAIYKKKDVGE